MAKGDVNAEVCPHYDAAEETMVWKLRVATHEDFTKTQVQSLATEAATSFAAFQSELGTLKPNWSLTTSQEAGLFESIKELDAF